MMVEGSAKGFWRWKVEEPDALSWIRDLQTGGVESVAESMRVTGSHVEIMDSLY